MEILRVERSRYVEDSSKFQGDGTFGTFMKERGKLYNWNIRSLVPIHVPWYTCYVSRFFDFRHIQFWHNNNIELISKFNFHYLRNHILMSIFGKDNYEFNVRNKQLQGFSRTP